MRWLLLLTLAVACGAQNTTLVASGATWKYYDSGALTVLPAVWAATSFGDGTWKSGPAPLGYNSTFVKTTVAKGSTTTYYRTYFTIAALPQGQSSVLLTLTVEDGAVVYLNGAEVGRYNMPALTTVLGTTLASAQVTAAAGSVSAQITILTTAMAVGKNCLAVELHTATGKVLHAVLDASLVLVAIPSPTATASTTLSKTHTPSSPPSASFSPLASGPSQIVSTAVWKYSATGTDLGSSWTATSYDDSAWATGRGILGASARPQLRAVAARARVRDRQ